MPTPAAVASVTDLRRVFDAGNYAGAVSAASRLSFTGGAAAAGLDKAQVYAIKGEAHLRLKQYAPAADAFAKAAKAAPDVATVALYTATEQLVRRSRNGAYTPKQPVPPAVVKPGPIDVTAVDKRAAALGSLFVDEFAAAGFKLRAAKAATSVPQLLAAAELANHLRLLELAATGGDAKTRPEVAGVADHAHALLESNLQTMAARVADIRRAANTTSITYTRVKDPSQAAGYYNQQVFRKAGLTQRNVQELNDVESTCQKVVPAADGFAKAAVAADAPGRGGNAAVWDALSAEATRVAALAQDVLSADYGNGLKR